MTSCEQSAITFATCPSFSQRMKLKIVWKFSLTTFLINSAFQKLFPKPFLPFQVRRHLELNYPSEVAHSCQLPVPGRVATSAQEAARWPQLHSSGHSDINAAFFSRQLSLRPQEPLERLLTKHWMPCWGKWLLLSVSEVYRDHVVFKQTKEMKFMAVRSG